MERQNQKLNSLVLVLGLVLIIKEGLLFGRS